MHRKGTLVSADRRNSWGRRLVRFRLLLAAFAPLFGVFAVLSWPNQTPTVIWIVATGFGVGVVPGLVRAHAKETTVDTILDCVEDRSGAVSGYLATYLLPFAGFVPTGLQDALAFGIFFAIVGTLHMRTDLAYVNPTLALVGWNLYAVKVKGRNEYRLALRKRRPHTNAEVRLTEWMGIYFRSG